MFKDDYKAAFSKVTASEETHRRILNMTNKKREHRRFGGWASKLAIAAVLVVFPVPPLPDVMAIILPIAAPCRVHCEA